MYIDYVLDTSILKPVSIRDGLECIKLTITNYKQNISDIKYCINLFNSEIDWDDMWTLSDAIKRFESGEIMYMAKSNNIPIGYVWLNDDFAYNLFMTKKRNHKNDVYDFFKHSLYDMKKHASLIKAHIDDWNIASQKVAERSGFVKY